MLVILLDGTIGSDPGQDGFSPPCETGEVMWFNRADDHQLVGFNAQSINKQLCAFLSCSQVNHVFIIAGYVDVDTILVALVKGAEDESKFIRGWTAVIPGADDELQLCWLDVIR